MNFFANMPKDPFADDPNDPASFVEDDEHNELVDPITAEERFALNRDLELVQEFAKHLSPRGIDGIFMFCEDCEEPHFYEWDIMASNMKSMLNDELSAVHEPGAEPDPNRYVPWEYAVGFIDGLNSHRFG
ncbi:DUF5319 domain-containing protein [Corynebacterium casei]|uniref:DUF5319 domain-containing protein n=1 Tax=Corynebacterium casei TaxID=160386 RepID=UPI003F9DFA2D